MDQPINKLQQRLVKELKLLEVGNVLYLHDEQCPHALAFTAEGIGCIQCQRELKPEDVVMVLIAPRAYIAPLSAKAILAVRHNYLEEQTRWGDVDDSY